MEEQSISHKKKFTTYEYLRIHSTTWRTFSAWKVAQKNYDDDDDSSVTCHGDS